MKRFLTASAIIALATVSLAADSGDAILKKAEQTMNAPRDTKAYVEMVLRNSDGSDIRKRTMVLYKMGKDLKLIKFLTPADQKDVGFLVLDDDNMYLWLPAFHRDRRIASHVKNQSFQGTDFSFDDIGTSDYTKHYSARLVETTDKVFALTLQRKSGSDKEYKTLKMTINKTTYLPEDIMMYNNDGRLIKKMTMKNVKIIKGYHVPTIVSIIDIAKKHETKMNMARMAIDTGMSSQIFTVRNLKRTAKVDF